MAGTGGTVTILWSRVGSVEVDISGPGSFTLTSDDSSATFPETVTTDEGFNTTSNGLYTVTVTHLGRTIFSKELQLVGDNGVVFNVELSQDELFDTLLGDRTSTTTALEDVAAAVNTVGKHAGKLVFNTTTGVLVVADGPAAGDTWSTAAGVATHTPV